MSVIHQKGIITQVVLHSRRKLVEHFNYFNPLFLYPTRIYGRTGRSEYPMTHILLF